MTENKFSDFYIVTKQGVTIIIDNKEMIDIISKYSSFEETVDKFLLIEDINKEPNIVNLSEISSITPVLLEEDLIGIKKTE